jgi:pantoate--beta-alanine ligase
MQQTGRRWKRAGMRVGLVPTMGYLHPGHRSLVRAARRKVGAPGKVVVSIYVNPTQFGPQEDFARYPRDLKRDLRLCRAEGVDVVFVPGDQEMYAGPGESAFSTFVSEETHSRVMEGRSRPTHFRGVTTVVAKLFNIVQPEVAVFGAKDYQQAAIIRRMTRDLNFPVRIVTAPTVREPDGLAMSSRNKYLKGDLRNQALVLWRAIQKTRARVGSAPRPVAAARIKTELKRFIEKEPDVRLDYVEFFAPETLMPLRSLAPGAHMALAVFIGKTRLIDNAALWAKADRGR